VLCVRSRGRGRTLCIGVMCDVRLCLECFQDYHTKLNFSGNKILFLCNSYKFTVPKLILKYIGVDIPIPYTSQNIMSKLRGEKIIFFPNLLPFK
jgi:hypothetical protein